MGKIARKRPLGQADEDELKEWVRRRARARIYLKDPLITEETGLLYDYVVVGSDTCIDRGPTSSRFLVVDYNSANDRVEPPARLRLKTIELKKGKSDLVNEFVGRHGTPQEAQVNAWATAVDTLELFQQPNTLGREIPWAFDGSRLRILPHAMIEPNAFYSRQTRALHFGYFMGTDNKPVKTALSHDIVAHETSHAIFDGLRPYYLSSIFPDTLAFHEYVGDLGAMLSLFRNPETVALVAPKTPKGKSFLGLISDLAPQVGEELYGDADRNFLRSADNPLTYHDVYKEEDVHRRSQVLSGFAFNLFKGIFEKALQEQNRWTYGKGRYKDAYAILVDTARIVGRMLIRPLDLLPPGDISFKEYAAILLEVDKQDHPDDKKGYREVMEKVMKERRIHPGGAGSLSFLFMWRPASRYRRRMIEKKMVERDINMIRSSRVGAYRFIDANRIYFRIPRKREFKVISLATNHREAEMGYRPPAETIIQYVWEERIKLPKELRNAGADNIVFPAGGTVVVDDNVNILYWIRQELNPERRELFQKQLDALIKNRQIEMDPTQGVRSGRPFILRCDGSGLGMLHVNACRMHEGRARRG